MSGQHGPYHCLSHFSLGFPAMPQELHQISQNDRTEQGSRRHPKNPEDPLGPFLQGESLISPSTLSMQVRQRVFSSSKFSGQSLIKYGAMVRIQLRLFFQRPRLALALIA